MTILLEAGALPGAAAMVVMPSEDDLFDLRVRQARQVVLPADR